jgi:hypothetical protein
MARVPAIQAGFPLSKNSTAPVATYAATVSLVVIRSSLDVSSPFATATRQAMLASPGYGAWPSRYLAQRGVDPAQLDDTTLALMRLKLVFDFGSRVEADSASSLAAAIDAEWPKLANARAAFVSARGTQAYEQAAVTAELASSGAATWGFMRNVNVGTVLPVPDVAATEGCRPEFDRYIQNMVRLDLQQRIEDRLA